MTTWQTFFDHLQKRFSRSTPRLHWQKIKSDQKKIRPLFRSAVPGGWLLSNEFGALTFLPDPDHRWDGHSVPPFLLDPQPAPTTTPGLPFD